MTAAADAHIHLFASGYSGSPLGPPPLPRDDFADYERLRHAFGIDLALLVGYEREPAYAGNNDHILRLANDHPWLAPLPYLHTAPAPTVDELRRFHARGALGYSLYLYRAEERAAFASWPEAVQTELESQRAILSLNSRPEVTKGIAPMVAKLEGCRVLFSHLGLPGRMAPNSDLIEARLRPLLDLADLDHVGVKLSGLYAVSEPHHDFPHVAAWPVVETLLQAFGSRRLYWSSDFPAALDYVSFAQTFDLRAVGHQSEVDVVAIRGGNLLRLMGRL